MSHELPKNFSEERIAKFLATWKHTDSEESTGQSFFRALCQLLGVAEPPEGRLDEGYRFEKRVSVPEGTVLRKKKADVYRRGVFVWENKCLKRTARGARTSRWVDWMREGYEQARRYARHLADDATDGKRPPILVVCDIGREIWMWNTFTMPDYGAFEDRREILLEDLLRPKVFRDLQWALTEPQRLNPLRESGRVTLAIAKSLGRLVNRLKIRLGGAEDMGEPIARFMMACIFTLFAEDAELLRAKVFREPLRQRWPERPELFVAEVKRLWTLMQKGGEDRQFGKIPKFNGGLFRDCPVLSLEAAEIRELATAASFDWTEVEPSIFGTLLEQSLRAHGSSGISVGC